jgi:adenylosuccinate lyase
VRVNTGFSNPLVERYAGKEMLLNFSPLRRYQLWRALWVALAEAEMKLGLPISKQQLDELKAYQGELDAARAGEIEKEVRHEVIAHIRAYAEQCPKAGGIIHLGATSCFVTDNSELIQARDGVRILITKLANVIEALADFAQEHKALPCVSYTHLQPAQPTTLGKRACLWLQDFLTDIEELERVCASIRFRGVKGTTGTQASFLKLFKGDAGKVRKLDQMVADKFGFEEAFPVTGQTYPRKLDSRIIDTLGQIAQSAAKFANDIRFLQHTGEVEEPFDQKQVGSSAMPYKRNPVRTERISALSRMVIAGGQGIRLTAAAQFLERTLDDSAIRRIMMPETFLATDAILDICLNVASGLVVHEEVIRRELSTHLPFVAAESILMAAVAAGGDRQELHELLRRHSMEARERVEAGEANDLLERISRDPAFSATKAEIDSAREPARMVGLAEEQTERFLAEVARPVLQNYREVLGMRSDLRV